jgi:hypothetical protein
MNHGFPSQPLDTFGLYQKGHILSPPPFNKNSSLLELTNIGNWAFIAMSSPENVITHRKECDTTIYDDTPVHLGSCRVGVARHEG